MAAHSVTILTEVKTKLNNGQIDRAYLDQLRHGLDNANGLDYPCIDTDDWAKISDAVNGLIEGGDTSFAPHFLNELEGAVLTALENSTKEWERLGQPRCYEDWVRARYPVLGPRAYPEETNEVPAD